jgi:hypothetical protein
VAALWVSFADTNEQEWFAPHLVEFLDYGGEQTMAIKGGPCFIRDPDGTCHEVEARPSLETSSTQAVNSAAL